MQAQFQIHKQNFFWTKCSSEKYMYISQTSTSHYSITFDSFKMEEKCLFVGNATHFSGNASNGFSKIHSLNALNVAAADQNDQKHIFRFK